MVSVCGSATFGVGIEGMLDLRHDGETLITSLYWNGPWKRIGNQLHVAHVNRTNYDVKVSTPPIKGIIGDLAVNISEASANEPML